MVVARVGNDINNGNNVVCKDIEVGNPEGHGGSGCAALAPNEIPKDAYILYTLYQHGEIVD